MNDMFNKSALARYIAEITTACNEHEVGTIQYYEAMRLAANDAIQRVKAHQSGDVCRCSKCLKDTAEAVDEIVKMVQ